MNQEQRAIHNKTYYQKNKTVIIGKGCTKVKCEFCDREIIKNNLLKHQTLAICKRKSDLKKENKKRLE